MTYEIISKNQTGGWVVDHRDVEDFNSAATLYQKRAEQYPLSTVRLLVDGTVIAETKPLPATVSDDTRHAFGKPSLAASRAEITARVHEATVITRESLIEHLQKLPRGGSISMTKEVYEMLTKPKLLSIPETDILRSVEVVNEIEKAIEKYLGDTDEPVPFLADNANDDSWIDLVYLLSDKGVRITVSPDDEVTVHPFLLKEAK